MKVRILLLVPMLLGLLQVSVNSAEPAISRLPAASESDPDVKKMFDAMRARNARIININKVLANAPAIAVANQGLAGSLSSTTLPRAYRELAIMRASQLIGSPYVQYQHTPMAKACGFSDAQLAALPTWRDSKLFDDKQRVVLAYAEGIAGKHDVDDATFTDVAKTFTPREIVALTMTITHYIDTSLMTKVLRIQTEPGGDAAPASC